MSVFGLVIDLIAKWTHLHNLHLPSNELSLAMDSNLPCLYLKTSPIARYESPLFLSVIILRRTYSPPCRRWYCLTAAVRFPRGTLQRVCALLVSLSREVVRRPAPPCLEPHLQSLIFASSFWGAFHIGRYHRVIFSSANERSIRLVCLANSYCPNAHVALCFMGVFAAITPYWKARRSFCVRRACAVSFAKPPQIKKDPSRRRAGPLWIQFFF